MKRTYALALAALAVPALVLPATASPAGADSGKGSDKGFDQGTEVYRSHLMELNDSGATGRVMMHLRGNELTVRIKARGLLPNHVHAQHIHGIGNSECPPDSAAGEDGVLSTADGLPFYGPIATSLTTHGDTSPAAGLEVAMMPVADSKGRVDYRRTITVPDAVADDLGAFQIVQHGVDLSGNGTYDFSAGPSELDGTLPQEATAPANCGTITPVPHQH